MPTTLMKMKINNLSLAVAAAAAAASTATSTTAATIAFMSTVVTTNVVKVRGLSACTSTMRRRPGRMTTSDPTVVPPHPPHFPPASVPCWSGRRTSSSSLSPRSGTKLQSHSLWTSSSTTQSSNILSTTTNNNIKLPHPRAAVAVAVRCAVVVDSSGSGSSDIVPHYLLVQRGNPPNAGQWSFPGGKLELGEALLDGAQRELGEEVLFDFAVGSGSTTTTTTTTATMSYNDDNHEHDLSHDLSLAWYLHGAFTTADSITFNDKPSPPITTTTTTKSSSESESDRRELMSHYLIGICFAEVVGMRTNPTHARGDNTPEFRTTTFLPTVTAMDDAADARWYTLPEIEEMQTRGRTTPGIFHKATTAELLHRHGILSTTTT